MTLKQDDDLTDKYDFIVHILNGDDYMFYSKNRDEIITCLRSAYFMLSEENLPVYEMSSKLHFYRTKKGAQKKIPGEQFRCAKVPDYQKMTSEERAQIEQCIAMGLKTFETQEDSDDDEANLDIQDEGENLSNLIPKNVRNVQMKGMSPRNVGPSKQPDSGISQSAPS